MIKYLIKKKKINIIKYELTKKKKKRIKEG
jgi:hypothetical protein